MQQSKLWTPNEIATLRKLVAKHNFAEIGKQVNRSKDSVRHKVIQLGLERPYNPVKPNTTPKVRRPVLVANKEPKKPAGHAWRAKPIGNRPPPNKEAKYIHSLHFVEYCPQCYAPVSNWQEHRIRLGHRRPAA
jgi:hypothetical protein